MMNEETNRLLAKWYLHQNHLSAVAPEDFSDWAVSQLENGFDSKNIRILASLQNPRSFSEIEDYFKRSLKDLDWEFPSKKDCLLRFAKDTAQKILSEEIKPVAGCYQISKISQALNHPSPLKAWIYLNEGLEPENYRMSVDWQVEEFSNQELETAIILAARKLSDKMQNV